MTEIIKKLIVIRYSLNSTLAYMLLFFSVFPYITFGVSPTPSSYLQPFFLIAAIVLMALNFDKIPLIFKGGERVGIFMSIIGATFILIASILEHKLQTLSAAYLSPFIFIVLVFAYRIVLPEYITLKSLSRVIKLVICIYLFVGLVQLFVNPSFLAFLIGGHKTGVFPNEGGVRGVIGLSSEPTYYASYMLGLAAVLSAITNEKKSVIFFIVVLIQVFLIAKSATAVAVVLLAGFICVVSFGRSNVLLLISVVFGCLLSLVTYHLLPDTLRVHILIDRVMDLDLSYFLFRDESTAIRLMNATFPFIYTFKNYFFPMIFLDQTWVQYLKSFDLIWFRNTPEGSRIISGYGEMLVLYGFFVLPLLRSFVKTLLANLKKDQQNFFLVCILLLLFTSFSFSTPLVALIYVLYNGNIKPTHKSHMI